MNPRGSSSSRLKLAAFATALLLGGAALGQMGQRPPQTPAPNPIPDSGAQFQRLIEETRITNQRLAEIASLLKQIRDRQEIFNRR